MRDDVSDRLRRLRADGYVFAHDLEGEVDELSRQLQALEPEVVVGVRRGVQDLSWKAQRLVDDFRRLEYTSGDVSHALDRLTADLDQLTREKDRLQQTIRQQLGGLPQRAQTLAARIAELRQHLDRGREACFSLQPSEAMYLAVAAEWKMTGFKRDDPDGILHVTNMRLVMERKEKTGGFLGIGGRRVQEVLWELAWSEIESLEAEQRGLMGVVDLVHFHLKHGASMKLPQVTVEVKGGVDADDFVQRLRPAFEGTLQPIIKT